MMFSAVFHVKPPKYMWKKRYYELKSKERRAVRMAAINEEEAQESSMKQGNEAAKLNLFFHGEVVAKVNENIQEIEAQDLKTGNLKESVEIQLEIKDKEEVKEDEGLQPKLVENVEDILQSAQPCVDSMATNSSTHIDQVGMDHDGLKLGSQPSALKQRMGHSGNPNFNMPEAIRGRSGTDSLLSVISQCGFPTEPLGTEISHDALYDMSCSRRISQDGQSIVPSVPGQAQNGLHNFAKVMTDDPLNVLPLATVLPHDTLYTPSIATVMSHGTLHTVLTSVMSHGALHPEPLSTVISDGHLHIAPSSSVISHDNMQAAPPTAVISHDMQSAYPSTLMSHNIVQTAPSRTVMSQDIVQTASSGTVMSHDNVQTGPSGTVMPYDIVQTAPSGMSHDLVRSAAPATVGSQGLMLTLPSVSQKQNAPLTTVASPAMYTAGKLPQLPEENLETFQPHPRKEVYAAASHSTSTGSVILEPAASSSKDAEPDISANTQGRRLRLNFKSSLAVSTVTTPALSSSPLSSGPCPASTVMNCSTLLQASPVFQEQMASKPTAQYDCHWSTCCRQYQDLSSLVRHVHDDHIKLERNTEYRCQWRGCPRSGRGFNARYKMLIHVRTHTNERPHACPACSKSFSRLENLKIHLRSHTGEKPYICPVEGCGKAYTNSSDRFKHVRTHQDEKPYFCKMPGCNKRYTDPSSLRKHVRTYSHSVNGVLSPSGQLPHSVLAISPQAYIKSGNSFTFPISSQVISIPNNMLQIANLASNPLLSSAVLHSNTQTISTQTEIPESGIAILAASAVQSMKAEVAMAELKSDPRLSDNNKGQDSPLDLSTSPDASQAEDATSDQGRIPLNIEFVNSIEF